MWVLKYKTAGKYYRCYHLNPGRYWVSQEEADKYPTEAAAYETLFNVFGYNKDHPSFKVFEVECLFGATVITVEIT